MTAAQELYKTWWSCTPAGFDNYAENILCFKCKFYKILSDLFTTILPLTVPLAFCWVTRETESPALFNISCFFIFLGMLSAHIASATNQSPVQCVYNSLLADGRSHSNTQHLWFKRTAHKIHAAWVWASHLHFPLFFTCISWSEALIQSD